MAKKSASMALAATTTPPAGPSTAAAPRPGGAPANPAHSTGYGRGNVGVTSLTQNMNMTSDSYACSAGLTLQ